MKSMCLDLECYALKGDCQIPEKNAPPDMSLTERQLVYRSANAYSKQSSPYREMAKKRQCDCPLSEGGCTYASKWINENVLRYI